jgi:Fe-S cluster assembly iron-binding protein IscA
MLTVTDAAVRHMAEVLYQSDADDEMAIRFVQEGRTIVPKLDKERPGDATYDHEGSTVLLLDENVFALLENRTVDIQDTEDGTQLIIF